MVKIRENAIKYYTLGALFIMEFKGTVYSLVVCCHRVLDVVSV